MVQQLLWHATCLLCCGMLEAILLQPSCRSTKVPDQGVRFKTGVVYNFSLNRISSCYCGTIKAAREVCLSMYACIQCYCDKLSSKTFDLLACLHLFVCQHNCFGSYGRLPLSITPVMPAHRWPNLILGTIQCISPCMVTFLPIGNDA